MKIIRGLIVIMGILVILFFMAGIFLPSQYKIKRSVTVSCPDSLVFNLVADFHNWLTWSPWAQVDSTAEHQFYGTPGKPGATWEWDGEKIGAGRLIITAIDSPKFIESELIFKEPQNTRTKNFWKFEREKDRTEIIWINAGKLDYPVGRYLGLFIEDVILGPPMEEGLNNLQRFCRERMEDRNEE
jgi:hypothetical protein